MGSTFFWGLPLPAYKTPSLRIWALAWAFAASPHPCTSGMKWLQQKRPLQNLQSCARTSTLFLQLLCEQVLSSFMACSMRASKSSSESGALGLDGLFLGFFFFVLGLGCGVGSSGTVFSLLSFVLFNLSSTNVSNVFSFRLGEGFVLFWVKWVDVEGKSNFFDTWIQRSAPSPVLICIKSNFSAT